MIDENQPENKDAALTGKDRTLPVIEEVVRIDKEVVEKGTVRIRKEVEEETVRVPLLSAQDKYTIEHVPINEFVDVAPSAVRYEGDTMIISVLVEEAVIQKRLKLVEELRITRSREESITHQDVILKKESVKVERSENE